MKTKCFSIPLIGLSLAFVSGCANQDFQGEFFEGQGVATRQTLQAQANVGARHDGMLHPQHFDNGALNSLGKTKLDMMLLDNEASLPLVVYLDLPANDAFAKDRHTAVETYLKEQGLLAENIKLENGTNPATLHSAYDSLSRMGKTEGSAGGAAGAAGGAGEAGSSAGGGMSSSPAGTTK